MPRKVRVSLKEIKGTLLYDDKNFNIKLVKEVEKYPCLYNTSIPEYYRRDLLDQAWENVGKALNEDRYVVREKWSNNRRTLVKILTREICRSYGVLETAGRPPYYLFEEIKFVIPFLKNYIYDTESGRIAFHPDYSCPLPFPGQNNETNDDDDDGDKAAAADEDSEQVFEVTDLEGNTKRIRDLSEISEALEFLEATNQLTLVENTHEPVGQVSDDRVVDFGDTEHMSQIMFSEQTEQQNTHELVVQVSNEVVVDSGDTEHASGTIISNQTEKQNTNKPVVQVSDEGVAASGDTKHVSRTITSKQTQKRNIHKSVFLSGVRVADSGDRERVAQTKKQKSELSVRDKVSVEIDNRPKLTDSDNYNEMFLMSLLPELCSMNEDQMRQFRRKALQIIDGLLEPQTVQYATCNQYVTSTPVIMTLEQEPNG